MLKMKDEFAEVLALATKEIKYPYGRTLLPKIESLVNHLFDPQNFCQYDVVLANNLLQRTSPPKTGNLGAFKQLTFQSFAPAIPPSTPSSLLPKSSASPTSAKTPPPHVTPPPKTTSTEK
jgi:hypothetical protein